MDMTLPTLLKEVHVLPGYELCYITTQSGDSQLKSADSFLEKDELSPTFPCILTDAILIACIAYRLRSKKIDQIGQKFFTKAGHGKNIDQRRSREAWGGPTGQFFNFSAKI